MTATKDMMELAKALLTPPEGFDVDENDVPTRPPEQKRTDEDPEQAFADLPHASCVISRAGKINNEKET